MSAPKKHKAGGCAARAMAAMNRVPAFPTVIMEVGFSLCMILLLMFILTTTHDMQQREAKLKVDLPEMATEGSGETDLKSASITIALENGKPVFLVDETRATVEQLQAAVGNESVENVDIRADDQVRFGTLMRVVEACQTNGSKPFTLVYEQKQ